MSVPSHLLSQCLNVSSDHISKPLTGREQSPRIRPRCRSTTSIAEPASPSHKRSVPSCHHDRTWPLGRKVAPAIHVRKDRVLTFGFGQHGGTAPCGGTTFGGTASKSPRFRHFSPRLAIAVNSCQWSSVARKPLIYKRKKPLSVDP